MKSIKVRMGGDHDHILKKLRRVGDRVVSDGALEMDLESLDDRLQEAFKQMGLPLMEAPRHTALQLLDGVSVNKLTLVFANNIPNHGFVEARLCSHIEEGDFQLKPSSGPLLIGTFKEDIPEKHWLARAELLGGVDMKLDLLPVGEGDGVGSVVCFYGRTFRLDEIKVRRIREKLEALVLRGDLEGLKKLRPKLRDYVQKNGEEVYESASQVLIID